MAAAPLRHLLLKDTLLVVGLGGALLTGGGWWVARTLLATQAQAHAEAGLKAAEGRIAQRLEEATRTGNALADWGRLGLLESMGTVQGQQLLLAELRSRPALTNLTFVRPDGRASAANLPEEGAPEVWLSRGTEGPAAQPSRILRRWDAQGNLLSEGPDPSAPPDWRQRPWVLQALHQGHPTWTAPYPFLGKVGFGLTYTVPIRRAGALQGVLGVDLVLGDLRPWMREARPTPNTRLAILDEAGRLVLPPEQDLEAASLGRALAPELLDPTRHPVPAAVRTHPDAGLPGKWPRVEVQGEVFLVQRRPIRLQGGPGWEILAAIPEEDLLREPRRIAWVALGWTLVSLALVAWRLIRGSQRVVHPLEALADEAQALAQGRIVDPPATPIAEVAALGDSLRRASLDLREKAHLEAQLRQAQRRDLVGTLAAGVAHDLGNLLSAVGANLEFAQDPGIPAEGRTRALDQAQKALRRSVGFLKALLAVGRPSEAPQAEGARHGVNLVQVVREAAGLLEPLLGSLITVHLDLPPDAVEVRADPIQLEQVLLNLSVNGRDAMPKGGTLTLGVGRQGDGRPFLWVADEGQGIPDHLRDHLFEAFVTTKTPDRGSGLGLAMVQAIARAHDAQVEVDSTPGRGSRFRFVFPLAAPEAPAHH